MSAQEIKGCLLEEELIDHENRAFEQLLVFGHPEGRLLLFRPYKFLVDELLEHSFVSNNLDKYVGQGRRGCYKLNLSLPIIIKPKSPLLLGYKEIRDCSEEDLRRISPFNEILCALQAELILRDIPSVEVEKPVGMFSSLDGQQFTIFEFEKRYQKIFADEKISPELGRAIAEVVDRLAMCGMKPLECHPSQFLRSGQKKLFVTDLEAYEPVTKRSQF